MTFPSFVRPLTCGGETVDEPLELDADAAAEVRAQLEEIDRARHRAAVSAQSYMVWR